MSSPSFSAWFPEWLTRPGTTEQEKRLCHYRDVVKFLRNKGIEYSDIPYKLFELMQAYVQDGTPIYYQDPLRRFTVWVGSGLPDPDSSLFFRV